MLVKKRNVKSVFVLFVCFSLFTVFGVGTVNCQQSYLYVTINADGSISPDPAPMTKEGTVYTLTDDVDALTISRSNMVLDGDSYTLTGNGKMMAVYVDSKNVTIMNLTIIGAEMGIALDISSSNVTVSNNTIMDVRSSIPELYQYAAIDLWGGGNHIIIGNQLINNYIGVKLAYFTSNNIIIGNNITANNQGINLWGVSNNTLYQNNFINNSIQIHDASTYYPDRGLLPSLNIWNNNNKGNYWSDYNSNDNDGDGIGDTPYVIDENNQDSYPLMVPTYTTNVSPVPTWMFLVLLCVAVLAGVVIIFWRHNKNKNKPLTMM